MSTELVSALLSAALLVLLLYLYGHDGDGGVA